MNTPRHYRGWSDFSKEWKYGFLASFRPDFEVSTVIYDLKGNNSYYVVPDSVGQWTGLKDKNGKEIYEGDIVLADIDDDRKNVKRIVKSYPGAFSLTDMEGDFQAYITMYRSMKIIGNTWENPELMGGANVRDV